MNLQSIDRLQHLLARVRANAQRPRIRTQGFGAYLAYAATPSEGQASRAQTPTAAAESTKPELRSTAQAAATQISAVAPAEIAEARQPIPEAVKAAAARQAAPEAAKIAAEARQPIAEPTKLEPRPAQPAKPEVFVEPSLPPISIPAEELEEIEISVSPEPPLAESGKHARAADIAALASEELPIEDVSGDELGVEEIPIEIGSEVTLEQPEMEPESGPESEPESEPTRAPVPAAAATSIQPQTYTAPPSLDELTFSEPPPAPSKHGARDSEIEPPPASLAQLVSEESEPPGSIDAALLAASEAQGTGSEAPVVTPPPESGPQVAVPPMGAPGLPRGTAPSVEQLGDLVELEPPSVIPLELAERKAAQARAPEKAVAESKAAEASEPEHEPVKALAPEQPKAAEDLEFVPCASQPSAKIEAREPMQTLVGGFTEEHGTGREALASEFVQQQVRVPSQGTQFAAEEPRTAASSPSALLTPETLVRPTPAAQEQVVDVISVVRAFRPHSFAELLDASLDLLK